ncbi:hypothetical protein [Propionivibrio soli]|jgi:hypothetical protein|uniref:hypothetical protein n=1 Tax=Propionivibrio soli TaxID=2976531 RepID=UPI0021E7C27E|nr:hypothetical protein [Propionivibrio soli]
MPLVPCRACGHQVDTTALACPQCGATDPGKKISRQQRNAIFFAVQLVFWLALLGLGGWYVWNTAIPLARQYIVKPQPEPPPAQRP